MKKEFLYFLAGIILSTCIFSIVYVTMTIRHTKENEAEFEKGYNYQKEFCDTYHYRY